jgi:hypothetical protein
MQGTRKKEIYIFLPSDFLFKYLGFCCSEAWRDSYYSLVGTEWNTEDHDFLRRRRSHREKASTLLLIRKEKRIPTAKEKKRPFLQPSSSNENIFMSINQEIFGERKKCGVRSLQFIWGDTSFHVLVIPLVSELSSFRMKSGRDKSNRDFLFEVEKMKVITLS